MRPIAFAFAALLLSSTAAAQTEKVKARQEQNVPKPSTVIFSEVSVGGDRDGPGGITITGSYKPIFENLIRVRTNFAFELNQSVDNL
jgi:hypothetical protein